MRAVDIGVRSMMMMRSIAQRPRRRQSLRLPHPMPAPDRGDFGLARILSVGGGRHPFEDLAADRPVALAFADSRACLALRLPLSASTMNNSGFAPAFRSLQSVSCRAGRKFLGVGGGLALDLALLLAP